MFKSPRLFASIVALCLLGIASVASADFTFAVGNRTSFSLGHVTLHYTSGGTSINIPTYGVYVTSVAGSIVSATINGQQVARPNIGPITLPDNRTVYLQWREQIVDVLDPSEWEMNGGKVMSTNSQ